MQEKRNDTYLAGLGSLGELLLTSLVVGTTLLEQGLGDRDLLFVSDALATREGSGDELRR